jgi:hypothetical protein
MPASVDINLYIPVFLAEILYNSLIGAPRLPTLIINYVVLSITYRHYLKLAQFMHLCEQEH